MNTEDLMQLHPFSLWLPAFSVLSRGRHPIRNSLAFVVTYSTSPVSLFLRIRDEVSEVFSLFLRQLPLFS